MNEIFASLRNTAFNELIDEHDESDYASDIEDSEPSSHVKRTEVEFEGKEIMLEESV